MPQPKPKNKEITKYKKFIETLTIQSLRILSLDVSVEENFHPPAVIIKEEKKRFEKIDNKTFKVYHEYNINGKKQKDEKIKLKIRVVYLITYHSEVSISEKFFSLLGNSSLYLHTWPYLRELVQEITTRMGLPPLILKPMFVKHSKLQK
ncbi:MAG: hypothetical protein ABH873_07460 [Candidatus Firestonebacteria bacterium]